LGFERLLGLVVLLNNSKIHYIVSIICTLGGYTRENMVAFDRLLEQIDAFIRKYYKNQMIKGLIWAVGIFLFSFLLTSGLEYFGRFGSLTRAVLFFSFIGVNGFVLVNYFLIPLFKLNAYGKRIDRKQAANIIGSFFPQISDRLLNTLQLNEDLSGQEGNLELIRASVVQRASTLSVVPFGQAVDYNENRRYMKYLLPVAFIFLCVAVFVPSLLKEGTERVVNYNTVFIPEAPFSFNVLDFETKVIEGENIDIALRLDGSELPDKVYMLSDQGKFLMVKTKRNEFKGKISKVAKSGSFYFVANEFASDSYNYEMLGRAAIGKFEATIQYPKYLGKETEIVNNAGDLTIPEGSIVTWSVATKNTEFVKIKVGSDIQTFKDQGFKISKTFSNSQLIQLVLKSSSDKKTDSSSFVVNVIKDASPTIQVEEVKDSISSGLRFFTGSIQDDYGLNNLSFVYSIISKNGKSRTEKMNVRPVTGTEIPFDFAVDFIREKLTVDDKVEYYFVVSDNDGVNGSKSTRSRTFVYELPSLDELNEKRDEEQEQAKEDLVEIMKRSQEFKKNIERMKKDMLNSKSSDWNKKNQVNQLQQEQQSILEMLENVQKKMNQSTDEKNQLSEMDEKLAEKQELINDLMQELMDDELRKLLDDLEKLLQENRRDELQEKLENLEMSSEDMNKELDRSLEMLKKLQVDEKIDALENELKELAKEQEKLKEDIENKKVSEENAEKKQDDIQNKFDQLKDDLKELNKLNEDLDRPMDLKNPESNQEKVQEQLNEAKEKLSKGKSGKAGENQQKAADEMKKMADELDEAQEEANEEQEAEDMGLLRNILESLVSLSLDQEWVMDKFVKVNVNDPSYRNFGRFQRTIIDNTLPVRDSILELAKRQPKIAKFIDEELRVIKVNHKLSVDDIDERRLRDLALHQQLAMTSFNNLALMFNESLQAMQKQAQAKDSKPGSGSCKKPGGGMPKPGEGMKPGNMKDMLKKQLESMEKGMKPGGKKPGDKPGENGADGMGGLGNKQIAKMAAEQSAIRRRMEEIRNELNKEGKGQGNQLNPLIDELEKQQEDLINKRFSPEMINRQKEILTRLLESEKALMERGFEDKRESKEGKNLKNGNQIRFDEYNKQKLKQIELLRTIDPVYNKYYKDKANQYFNGGM